MSMLAHHLADRRPVGLEQVLSVAELTTRVELKYILPLAACPTFLHRLPDQLAVLDIGGRRIFDYESVYFDTERFALYHQHVQGRRNRYKARVRSYCDSGDAMFEVKFKGRRGQTVKARLPYDFRCRGELTPEGREFLDTVIAEAYGFTPPPLEPSLTTTYRRATLVDLDRASRLTIDVNLSWSDRVSSHRAEDLALIESKSLAGPGPPTHCCAPWECVPSGSASTAWALPCCTQTRGKPLEPAADSPVRLATDGRGHTGRGSRPRPGAAGQVAAQITYALT